ncbi:nitrilase-related carbon-nitrogen hydrolase [Kribbella sp. NPDC004536]|uniref:nitrilase-related carbon-nitrogen hydrolase n=1 Tax=Kribbella sp. NPDC004536 TaxID=3364106 RepID=UPI003688E21A
MDNLSSGWRKWLWLLAGAGLGVVGTNTTWSIAVAGWVFSVCLMRFTRASGVLAGFLWVCLGSAASTVLGVAAAGQSGTAAILVGCLVLSVLLSLPLLADRLVAARLGPLLGTLVFPAARVAVEFLIASTSPLGTIFGPLGTSQSTNLPLLQLVSVTGIYGISFLMAWAAPVANLLLERRGARPAAAYASVLGLVLLGGGLRLAAAPAHGELVRVAGVSVSQAAEDRKRQLAGRPAEAYAALNDDLFAQTRREASGGAKIVAWPEAGAAVLEPDYPAFLAAARNVARDNHIYLDLGVAVMRTGRPHSRDLAVLVSPDGQVLSTYDKAHPVPGLEDLKPGDGRVPVTSTPYGRLANVICFDADFPSTLRTRADVMFVPSNDWRGVERIHARNAVFRAVENGYALVRQTSGGLAISTDAYGVPLARTDYFSTPQQSMVVYVPTHGTRTVYGVVGDLFAWLCAAAATGLLGAGLVRRKGALR